MPTFTISWDNTSILSNPNIAGVRVNYAISDTVGGWGAWITNTGITPPNDIIKTIKTATVTVTPYNTKVRIKVQSVCSIGGPIDNEDGWDETIAFKCITATVTTTYNSSTININLDNTDIQKVKLSVKRNSDGYTILPPTIVTRANNAVTYTVNSLAAKTNYTWYAELITELSLDGGTTTVTAISSDAKYLGAPCPTAFITTDPPKCDPVTGIDVTAIN